jgi:hypothetical protein
VHANPLALSQTESTAFEFTLSIKLLNVNVGAVAFTALEAQTSPEQLHTVTRAAAKEVLFV